MPLAPACRKGRRMRRLCRPCTPALLSLAATAAAAAQELTPTEIVAAAPAAAWRDDPGRRSAGDRARGRRPGGDPARAGLRAGPCRQHPHAGRGRLVGRAPRSIASRTIMSPNGAITRASKPLSAGRRSPSRRPNITAAREGLDDHAARLARRLCARAPASRAAGRSPTIPRRAPPTSPIATPGSGSAAACRPTPAPAASFTRSIGHAPRHLDRNIAVVGRVDRGHRAFERAAARHRGAGLLQGSAVADVPIVGVRLAVGAARRRAAAVRISRHGSASFAAYLQRRKNRQDDFYHSSCRRGRSVQRRRCRCAPVPRAADVGSGRPRPAPVRGCGAG